MSDVKLIQGDFFAKYRQLKDRFDLILTDPPYGILERAGQKWDKPINWDRAEGIFYNLLKPNGQVIMFADWNLMLTLMGAFSRKLKFKHFHVWVKPGGMSVNECNPVHDCEHILIFKRKEDQANNLTFKPKESGRVGKPYSKRNYDQDISTRKERKRPVDINETGKRWIKTALYGPSKPNMTRDERTNHPTQKPLSLLRELVRVYSNPGDLILDPFAGSGSTLIAAYQEGRDSIGYEIEQEYFQEAQNRISRYSQQTALNLEGVS